MNAMGPSSISSMSMSKSIEQSERKIQGHAKTSSEKLVTSTDCIPIKRPMAKIHPGSTRERVLVPILACSLSRSTYLEFGQEHCKDSDLSVIANHRARIRQ